MEWDSSDQGRYSLGRLRNSMCVRERAEEGKEVDQAAVVLPTMTTDLYFTLDFYKGLSSIQSCKAIIVCSHLGYCDPFFKLLLFA